MKFERVAIGEHVLFLGDCREVFESVDVGGVFAVVTDPPYGIGYSHSGGGKFPPGSLRRFRHGGKVIVGDEGPFDPSLLLGFENVLCWGANHFAGRLPAGGRWLAWNKLAGMAVRDSFSDVEFAWHSLGGASRIIDYGWKGIAGRKVGESNGVRLHPNMKPLGVMRWCLEQVGASEGDLILDPYMGSGSTGVASVQLGMRFVGVEIEREYFEVACRRLSEAVAVGRQLELSSFSLEKEKEAKRNQLEIS